MVVNLLSDRAGLGYVFGAGLVDIFENMFDDVRQLIVLGVILVAMVFVIMTWMRTRSLVPTLGALLLGALIIWGVGSTQWFADRVGEDVEDFNQDSDGGGDRPGADEG